VRAGSSAGCPWAGEVAEDAGHSSVLTWEAARAASAESSQLLGTHRALCVVGID